MDNATRIDRTEMTLAAVFVAGLALASVVGMPWAVFAAAFGLAALFAAVMHWLTRRDRHRRDVAEVAAGQKHRPQFDPRAKKRKQRH